VDNGKQEDELNVTAADKSHSTAATLQGSTAHLAAATTPTVARTGRVRPTSGKRLAAAEKEAATAATSATVRRVTRSAAKENSNTINVPPAIPEATPRRALKTNKAASAAPAGGAVRAARP